jgi:hypothetical protein
MGDSFSKVGGQGSWLNVELKHGCTLDGNSNGRAQHSGPARAVSSLRLQSTNQVQGNGAHGEMKPGGLGCDARLTDLALAAGRRRKLGDHGAGAGHVISSASLFTARDNHGSVPKREKGCD